MTSLDVYQKLLIWVISLLPVTIVEMMPLYVYCIALGFRTVALIDCNPEMCLIEFCITQKWYI